MYLEELETRTLLSGLTIITHGFNDSANTGSWVWEMAQTISASLPDGAEIYTVTVKDPDHGNFAQTGQPNNDALQVTSVVYDSGKPALNTDDPQVIICLDWSDVAGSIVGDGYVGGYIRSTVDVAQAFTQWLTQTGLPDFTSTPVISLPIHLIGHSRGGSLGAEIADDLGEGGIWVNQLTTLDPHPLTSVDSFFVGTADPAVQVYDNVIFADNYYETDYWIHGEAVDGAANYGPLTLGGAYGFLSGGEHSDVHLFYQGTIAPPSSDTNYWLGSYDGSQFAEYDWYTNNQFDPTTMGFDYTLIAGGPRPPAGISTLFGGDGVRASRDYHECQVGRH